MLNKHEGIYLFFCSRNYKYVSENLFNDKGHHNPVESDELEVSTPSLMSSFIVDSDVSPIPLVCQTVHMSLLLLLSFFIL